MKQKKSNLSKVVCFLIILTVISSQGFSFFNKNSTKNSFLDYCNIFNQPCNIMYIVVPSFRSVEKEELYAQKLAARYFLLQKSLYIEFVQLIATNSAVVFDKSDYRYLYDENSVPLIAEEFKIITSKQLGSGYTVYSIKNSTASSKSRATVYGIEASAFVKKEGVPYWVNNTPQSSLGYCVAVGFMKTSRDLSQCIFEADMTVAQQLALDKNIQLKSNLENSSQEMGRVKAQKNLETISQYTSETLTEFTIVDRWLDKNGNIYSLGICK